MRRPRRSLSGPNSSWPSASPATQAVSVSWTADALVFIARAISGNAGRYMSIDSGPIALTDPSTTMSRATLGTASTLRGGLSRPARGYASPHGRRQRSRTPEVPQVPPHDDDLARRGHRRRPVRGLQRCDPYDGPGLGGLLPDGGRPGRADHADARRDGGGQPAGRIVRRVRAALARRLGGLHHRLALLVLLVDRAGDRGGRRRGDPPALGRPPAVAHGARADDAAARRQPRVGEVVRRVRVLVR